MTTTKLFLPVVFTSALLLLTSCLFSQGTWATKAPLPAAGRWAPVAFTIGTKGYLGTGMAASGTLNDFWEYDPVANSWTQMANFSGGVRSAAVGFAIGNYGYIGTGKDGGTNYFNDLWKYDPALNTWTQVATMSGVPRNMAFGFSAAGKGYVGTGKNSTNNMLNDLWEYDPITDSWAAKANYVGGNRMDIDKAVFVICNKAYLGTGFDGSDKNDFWEYDPGINTWTQKANFPGAPRSGATGFSIGSRGYLGLGSASIITYYANYWKYNPVTNSWSPISAFPGIARFDAPSFVINNKAYVGTGSENLAPVTYFNDLREYTPDSVIGGSLTAAITSSNNTICSGQSVTLSGIGGTSYSWSNGSTNNPIIVSPSATTTYSVTVTDIICGSSATAAITITVGNLIASTTSSTICAGQIATLTASGGNTYAWSNGATTSFITPSPTATTTYSVLVSIGNCSGSASATVTVNNAAAPAITGNTVLCSGDIATLTASGGNSYSWSTGATTAAITASPSSTTSYTVVATNASGCTSSNTVTVSITNAVAAVISCQNVCGGNNATLVASGGATYLWSNGAITSTITVSPAAATNYSVIVSVGSCADTADCTVNIFPTPVVSATSNVTIAQGQNATLTATGGGTYSWSNGATDNIITVSPGVTTQYCVIANDANSCTGTACVTVTLEPVDCSPSLTGELFLPNVFSPNGDGENDALQLYYGDFECLIAFKLIVYNRWGEKVFETTDPAFTWNGSYKNQIMNTAVFVYYLNATLISGEQIAKKGNISLLR